MHPPIEFYPTQFLLAKLLRLGKVVNGLRLHLRAGNDKDAKGNAEYGQKSEEKVVEAVVKHLLYPTTLLHREIPS